MEYPMSCRGYPNTRSHHLQAIAVPTRQEMNALFQLCRSGHWDSVNQCLQMNPLMAKTPMIMDNHIATTAMHQAITSKGEVTQRADVIRLILNQTPEAARIKNGYGSLPLHVICQRNVKIDSTTKQELIYKLIQAHEGAISEAGGVGLRTPLHIIFTDYISVELTRTMVEKGRKATFMKDKNGYLPAHVACSRHCSPEKLRMLLNSNPAALLETTSKGETLLSLASKKATKSHPNFNLIDTIKEYLEQARRLNPNTTSAWGQARALMPESESSGSSSNEQDGNFPNRISSEGSDESPTTIHENHNNNRRKRQRERQPRAVKRRTGRRYTSPPASLGPAPASLGRTHASFGTAHESLRPAHEMATRSNKKRKTKVEEDTPAALLLHFSRNGSTQTPPVHQVTQTAEV